MEQSTPTLTSKANLAPTFRSQNRFDFAEHFGDVGDKNMRVLDDQHPATPAAMSSLACTLESQSRNQDAMTLLRTCVQMQAQVIGDQHPDT